MQTINLVLHNQQQQSNKQVTFQLLKYLFMWSGENTNNDLNLNNPKQQMYIMLLYITTPQS